MRLLALDIGSKRIGIAVSDPLGLIAQGHSVWLRKETPETDYLYIAKLCGEYEDIEGIVVGLPLNMDGSYGFKAKEIERFIKDLTKYVDCPIITWDERMTTVSAERLLLSADVSREKRKKVIDKLAAVYILQAYLDRVNYLK